MVRDRHQRSLETRPGIAGVISSGPFDLNGISVPRRGMATTGGSSLATATIKRPGEPVDAEPITMAS